MVKAGDIIDFSNGGRVIVNFLQDGEVFSATYYPGSDDPVLRRMTTEDFNASLRITREKLAEAA